MKIEENKETRKERERKRGKAGRRGEERRRKERERTAAGMSRPPVDRRDRRGLCPSVPVGKR